MSSCVMSARPTAAPVPHTVSREVCEVVLSFVAAVAALTAALERYTAGLVYEVGDAPPALSARPAYEPTVVAGISHVTRTTAASAQAQPVVIIGGREQLSSMWSRASAYRKYQQLRRATVVIQKCARGRAVRRTVRLPTASPLPGHYIVECGAIGDCLYHSFAFMMQHAAKSIQVPVGLRPKPGVALADAHLHIRKIIQTRLKGTAVKMPLDARWFEGYETTGQRSLHTVAAYIRHYEDLSVKDYCASNSEPTTAGGVPEIAAWAAMTRRAVIVITRLLSTGTYVQHPDGSCDWTTEGVTAAVATADAWLVFNCIWDVTDDSTGKYTHSVSHYMPLVPCDMLDPDVRPYRLDFTCATPAWAHFISRPDMLHGDGVRLPMPVATFRADSL